MDFRIFSQVLESVLRLLAHVAPPDRSQLAAFRQPLARRDEWSLATKKEELKFFFTEYF